MRKRKIIWTNAAVEALDEFCEYIHRESPSAARRVKKEIVLTAKKLATHPEMYQLDEFFAEHKNIRRFFRWSYRIVYQVLETEVVILGVFHSSSPSDGD